MTSPLRKENEQELTTADIAQGRRTESQAEVEQAEIEQGRAKSVQRQPVEITSGQRPATGSQNAASQSLEAPPLFPDQELPELRSKWDTIQAGFVDQPRKAVEEADSLVASTMKRLAEVFAEERSKLEGQWDRGDDVSTEDLRLALQRYRSFFHRLLTI
jgi:hypothetical protein